MPLPCESLLCAVVLDGMTGTKHKANSELIGQGLGNIVARTFAAERAIAAVAVIPPKNGATMLPSPWPISSLLAYLCCARWCSTV
jgi:hypothetical protein